MRKLVLLLLAISPFLATNANAAYTCSSNAAACVKKGGSKAVCYDPSRMSSCKSSGVYIGPSGKSWPAKKGSS
jgi:putative component of membrane protein insertase Oxa1/YidC/SpoIIIJ protein YidD